MVLPMSCRLKSTVINSMQDDIQSAQGGCFIYDHEKERGAGGGEKGGKRRVGGGKEDKRKKGVAHDYKNKKKVAHALLKSRFCDCE